MEHAIILCMPTGAGRYSGEMVSVLDTNKMVRVHALTRSSFCGLGQDFSNSTPLHLRIA